MIGTKGKVGACLRGWGASKQSYSCLGSRVNRLGKFTGPDSIFMQMLNWGAKTQWVGRYKWLTIICSLPEIPTWPTAAISASTGKVWTSHFLPVRLKIKLYVIPHSGSRSKWGTGGGCLCWINKGREGHDFFCPATGWCRTGNQGLIFELWCKTFKRCNFTDILYMSVNIYVIL